MKSIALILLTLLSINIFPSCVNKPIEAQLKKAENFMDEFPDSSLKILQAMNVKDNCPDLSLARYALLLAKACDKNYILIKDDALLRKGMMGFEKHGDKTGAMWCRFYMGVCKFNASEYRSALSEALSALDLAHELENGYACGKINELIADIYQHSYNYNKSADYRSRAIVNFRKVRKNEYVRYASIDLANTCVKIGDTSRARHILDSIGAVPDLDDAYFNLYRQASYIPILMKEDRDGEAYSLYCHMSENNEEYIYEFLDVTVIAELLIKVDKLEKEWHVFNDMESRYKQSIDRESYHLVKAMYYAHTGDYKLSIEETSKADSIHNAKLSDALNGDLLEVEKNHTAKLLDKNKDSERNVRRILYITIILLVVFLFAWLINSLITKKIKIKKTEQLMLLAKDFKAGMEKEREEKSRITNEYISYKQQFTDLYEALQIKSDEKPEVLRDKINEIQNVADGLRNENNNEKSKWAIHKEKLLELSRLYFCILSELGNAYFDSCTSRNDFSVLRSAFEKKIEIMNDDKFQDLLFTVINNCYDNILNEFKEAFPYLKKKYLTFFAYQILRLSSKETCLLMDIKYPSFYTIQRRLKSYILESDSALKEKFLNAAGFKR